MITYILLLQSLFHLLASCPSFCTCHNNIVSCVEVILDIVPADLPSSTRILNLSSNRIQTLTDTNFIGLSNLEELYIESNDISAVHPHAFRNNVRLKVLNIRNNSLYELSEILFDNNNLIAHIDVSDNPQLTYLPYQFVQNKYSLKSLIANTVNCDCSMNSWHESLSTLQTENVDIDVSCYNPSDYRGYRIDYLPAGTFAGCGGTTEICSKGELLCDGYVCLPESQVCDGNFDCRDLLDEEGCTDEDELDCNALDDVFMCANGGCVVSGWVCDGYDDCDDKSDEANCTTNSGNEVTKCEDQFECNNGRCVDMSTKCDGVNDCGDWTDESKLLCGDLEAANVCPPGWMICGLGGGCIDSKHLCNGVEDCPDNSDELNCYDNCTAQCRSDGRCIKESWVCDTVPDCSDGSDEVNCDYVCGEDEVKCGGCVSCSFVCDGYNDCADLLDETSCLICNGSMCLELEQTKSGVTTIVIIATTVSACISITSVILFIVVYRQRRKATRQDALQPPLYTEIDHSFRGGVPGTPPPRYKSEPDIAARLMSVETPRENHSSQFRHVGDEI
ncbi:hypothetical protein ACHWQZ_G012708 [Mnemiopsis leidyi]